MTVERTVTVDDQADPPIGNAPTTKAPSQVRDGKWNRKASADQVMNVATWGSEAPAWFVLPVLLLVSGLLARPLARLANKLLTG